MSRAAHLALLFLSGAMPFAAAPAAVGDGFENFNHFPVTVATYASGTFLGQDGSTWTFVECQGNNLLTPPRTPGLAKGFPLAHVASGTIAGGCGTLSFDWMRLQTNCSFDVWINGVVRHTLTGGVRNVTNHVDSLAIHVSGDFTLKIAQSHSKAGQVAIDNVAWTSYGGGPPQPPELLFVPDTGFVRTAYGQLVGLTVTAAEPNQDAVSLWASGLPAGAVFDAVEGTSSVAAAFSWTPTSVQTGLHPVVFYAGDKDGTNSRAFTIEVTPVYPYYHSAEGLSGAALQAALHDIVSSGAVELGSAQEDAAMADIHTDPDNPDHVLLLYNPTSSVPKSAYNDVWNKEHCWPESRGLEEGNGPDQVDVHNLYAEDVAVNNLRGALFFDESTSSDSNYVWPIPGSSLETSRDNDSWEPPDASKGNVARALFYMATRYDGSEPNTSALGFADAPTVPNVSMGMLRTLLRWHVQDPPDDWERNRNEIIYSRYQRNRNPFIDRPEWAEAIWGTDSDDDGATDTHEWIAGTATNDPGSVFRASLSPSQIVCGSLSSGSVWRLYQGFYVSNGIVWQPIAQTSNLVSGTLRFNVAPTGPATFYHLRAQRQ